MTLVIYERGLFMGKCGAYTILIVDDNHNNLFTLRALIEEYIDANVIEADCGEKALQELFRHSVDLIILDVQMNGMDGFEVASIIKQRKRTADIPIVFLTASCKNDGFKKRGFEVGAVDYLTKPIDEYQLINRINVYLKIIEKERNMNINLEQKVHEKTVQLRKAKEAAEQANEAKSVFLANISHELRTPLNILLSATQLMKLNIREDEELDRAKLLSRTDLQVQNCYRLLRLINNLIDITKIDAGFFSLVLSKCNIIEVVEEITLSVIEYVENKGINLIFDTDMEERMIECDPDTIERIMLNLLSNAVKFTPSSGTINVDVKNTDDYVKISVSDTGVGIPEDKQDMIFERFMQVENLFTREAEGSGIGLSLVKSLVEMHCGKVYVKSEKGKGSKFIVEIPVNLKGDSNNNLRAFNAIDNTMQKIQVEFSDIYY